MTNEERIKQVADNLAKLQIQRAELDDRIEALEDEYESLRRALRPWPWPRQPLTAREVQQQLQRALNQQYANIAMRDYENRY